MTGVQTCALPILEEIFNPKMKQSAGIYKLFKNLNNTYIQEVFASMSEDAILGLGGANHESHA